MTNNTEKKINNGSRPIGDPDVKKVADNAFNMAKLLI